VEARAKNLGYLRQFKTLAANPRVRFSPNHILVILQKRKGNVVAAKRDLCDSDNEAKARKLGCLRQFKVLAARETGKCSPLEILERLQKQGGSAVAFKHALRDSPLEARARKQGYLVRFRSLLSRVGRKSSPSKILRMLEKTNGNAVAAARALLYPPLEAKAWKLGYLRQFKTLTANRDLKVSSSKVLEMLQKKKGSIIRTKEALRG